VFAWRSKFVPRDYSLYNSKECMRCWTEKLLKTLPENVWDEEDSWQVMNPIRKIPRHKKANLMWVRYPEILTSKPHHSIKLSRIYNGKADGTFFSFVTSYSSSAEARKTMHFGNINNSKEWWPRLQKFVLKRTSGITHDEVISYRSADEIFRLNFIGTERFDFVLCF